MYNIKLLNFYYSYIKNILPDYFASSFRIDLQRNVHNTNTHNNKYLTHKVQHAFAENCIRYQLPIFLNKTNFNIRQNRHTQQTGNKIILQKFYKEKLYRHLRSGKLLRM